MIKLDFSTQIFKRFSDLALIKKIKISQIKKTKRYVINVRSFHDKGLQNFPIWINIGACTQHFIKTQNIEVIDNTCHGNATVPYKMPASRMQT